MEVVTLMLNVLATAEGVGNNLDVACVVTPEPHVVQESCNCFSRASRRTGGRIRALQSWLSQVITPR